MNQVTRGCRELRIFSRANFSDPGRDRLNDDGIFVQWLQIYQLSTNSLRSVLATFHDTFPYVQVFRVDGAWKGKDLLLVGSKTPLSLDLHQGASSRSTNRSGTRARQDHE